jgi:SAM-dependent methyltransferase
MSDTYVDVDQSGHVGLAITWQERIASWPAVQSYKRRTWQLLASAERVIDVGSGAGDDLLGVGPGRCIGVDRSAAMCDRARQRGATVLQGDAYDLPFGDAAFSGGRADRTFQHLDDPAAAVRELVRVVRPGSPVVLADPDQESLVIEVPGVRPSVLQRLKALRRDVGYRNGCWISTAPSVLDQCGADVVAVEPFALALRDPADAFGLSGWPHIWKDDGGFTDDELTEWDAAMADPAPGFLYLLTFVVVCSVRR